MKDISIPVTGVLSGLTLVQDVNSGFTVLQASIGGFLSKNVAGNTNVTLTADEANTKLIQLSGALTGNISVIMPASSMDWVIKNATTGNYTITVIAQGGAGVAVPQGQAMNLWSDGTNVYLAQNTNYLGLGGGTLTGALNEAQGADIASSATVNLTTATGNYVNITGTTAITGITLAQGAERTVVFKGALTLTAGANLILPSSGNITTAAGDTAIFRGEASGVVRCVVYQVASAVVTASGIFTRTDPTSVVFTATGAGTISIKAGTKIAVGNNLVTYSTATAVSMPTLTAGTDYIVWVKDDGTIQATSDYINAPATGNWRKIGGFHYAPGGNATAQTGGNTTPAINPYSLWDLKFRPACSDPRGMTLVAGGFWADIYLTNTNPDVNGTSKYNVTMADGASPSKVPSAFGGNGTTAYTSLTWFEASEISSAYGKRLLTQREFMAAAYGTTEASAIGTDQVSTILNAAYTSKWGVMQATGILWVWGDDRGGPYAGTTWNANTNGRGSEYNAPNAVLLGGNWSGGSICGSRCSYWDFAAWNSNNTVGVRCACDHLLLD